GGSCRFVTRPCPGSAPGSAPAVPVLAVALTLHPGVEPELREGVEVRAVPVLEVRRQVRAHASFDLGRQPKVEVPIDPPHHGERVIHQLGVPDVEKTLGRSAPVVTRREPASDVVGEHPRHLRPDRERIDRTTERPPQDYMEARDRRDDLQRVSMGDDDVRVGVDGVQRTQAREVWRGLQEPTLARVSPLQVLEEAPVIAVRRLEVLLLEPRLVGGDEPVRRELEAQERMAEDDDALLGEPCADGMDLPELRGEAEEPADLTCRPLDAWVAVAGRLLGWRRGEAQFPVQWNPARGILRQQAVQEGRAAARQTRDDQWSPDLLARDPGMPRSIALQQEAIHEHAGEISERRDAAHEI